MAIAKKKKRFYDVEIPIIGRTAQIFAIEIEELNGKHVKYDLTRQLKGKGTILQAKIKATDKEATAYPTRLTVLPSFLKRMVRKGTNYVEESFETETKDALVRIKPFLVTRKKVSRRVRQALRSKCREEIVSQLKNRETEEIFTGILRGSLQKHLSIVLKKIYPLALVEIKEMYIVKEKSAQTLKKEAVETTESQ